MRVTQFAAAVILVSCASCSRESPSAANRSPHGDAVPHQGVDQDSSKFEDSTSQAHAATVIKIPGQTLLFQPTREDFTVGQVVFSVFSANPESIQVNGSGPDANSVVSDPPQAFIYTYLEQVSENRFELPAMTIEFGKADHVCMSVKAWFSEVPNEHDSQYYQDIDDRYALVSYCTSPPVDSALGKARFSQNRVATVGEFKAALSRPFVIELNQRPLPE